MQKSEICQISSDIFQYQYLDQDIPTKVYRIQDLNIGAPRRTELATLDRRVVWFSLAVYLRRFILLTGGLTGYTG